MDHGEGFHRIFTPRVQLGCSRVRAPIRMVLWERVGGRERRSGGVDHGEGFHRIFTPRVQLGCSRVRAPIRMVLWERVCVSSF